MNAKRLVAVRRDAADEEMAKRDEAVEEYAVPGSESLFVLGGDLRHAPIVRRVAALG
jgi:hypothetical protein